MKTSPVKAPTVAKKPKREKSPKEIEAEADFMDEQTYENTVMLGNGTCCWSLCYLNIHFFISKRPIKASTIGRVWSSCISNAC